MRRMAAILIAGVLLAASSARAAVAVALQSRAVVSAELMRVGDVARVTGDDRFLRTAVAAVKLGATPSGEAVVTAEDVRKAVAEEGLDPADVTVSGAAQVVGARVATVPRSAPAAQSFTAASLDSAIAGYMASVHKVSAAKVAVDIKHRELLPRPPQQEDGLAWTVLSHREQRQKASYKFEVEVTRGTETISSGQVTADVFSKIEWLVAAKNLAAGAEVQATDVELRSIAVPGFDAKPFSDKEAVVGARVLTNLRSGTPLGPQYFGAPLAVREKDIVSVQIESATFSAAAAGTALEQGARGDVIRIQLASTDRVIRCRVTGKRSVKAEPEGE
jgi:flagella basal body P-ring formation protein FlgA